jgi:cytochrome b pre-mRNA-processing protein 3
LATIRSLLGLARPYERVGFLLYGAAVAAARAPFFYATLNVPDTLDGRFDMVGLYVFLLIDRLQKEPPEGPRVAQAVFDAMFSDMDVNLREMGVGDLSVGKKVKVMWKALHGRSAVYAAGLEPNTEPWALEAAFVRNIWRGKAPPPAAPAMLGRLVRAQRAHLAAQGLDQLRQGEVHFLPAEEAAR